MKKLIIAMATTVAALVAAAVVWSMCEAPALAETRRWSSPPVTEDDDVDDWDMEEAIKRARAEEQALLPPPRPDPYIDLEARMSKAIAQENPWYRNRPRRAERLARIILDAAIDHDQNPWIALAIAYKESSFAPGIGRLRVTGELGEEGYFQIMPNSAVRRLCGQGRSMGNARANADTAMCWLSYVRGHCETDDPWQYVSAYGMRRCPRPGQGRQLRPSRRARKILARMVGDEECEAIWPTKVSP